MKTIGVRWLLVCVLVACGTAWAEDWPNWRGPRHDGISTEKAVKTDWSAPPKMLWEHKTGAAFSAFACVKDKVYTCGTEAKQQVLMCLNADTGEVIWNTPYEKELKDRQGGDGTRSTPTVDDGRVYIVGGHGTLLCADAATGKEIWKHQLQRKPNWGYSGSVLIEGDLAIVPAGGDDGSILAVEKKTGKTVWKCGDENPGYSTPYPFTLNGKKYIFCFSAKSGLIADAKTGKQVGRIPWETDYDVNASEPHYHDGHIFLTTGYNTGCALFRLKAEDDQISATEVWRSKVLMTKFTSCVLADGKLYGGDQRGMRCVDLMTGKELWKDDGLDNASVLLAGEWLIVQTEKGDVLLGKADPSAFATAGKLSPMKGRSWTVPTLSNGRLYVRNLEKAVCIDLRQ